VANGGGALPADTRAYVMIVTSLSVDAWRARTVDPADYSPDSDADFPSACLTMADAVRSPDLLARSW
ncbi:hypothetical protein VW35_16475, partial [Devosia soli]